MKKILSATLAFAFMATTAFAQSPAKQTKSAVKKVKVEAPVQAATKPGSATQHLKKDGTPDMRYKENKMAKPAKVKVKTK